MTSHAWSESDRQLNCRSRSLPMKRCDSRNPSHFTIESGASLFNIDRSRSAEASREMPGVDGTQFDHLTRKLAVFSRRRLIGLALATIGISVAPAAARSQPEGLVVLGGACAIDSDCVHGGPYGVCPMVDPVCGNNGFISDGSLTCCFDTYGCCTSDADCCGEMRCIGQYEFGSRCMLAPVSSRHVGEVCVTNADCVYWPGCQAECVDQRCQCNSRWDSVSSAPTDRPLISDDDAALQAADAISALEVGGDVFGMYRSMHPDAQSLIPAPAVIGWYKNEFLHFGEPAPEAVKVRFMPWTWNVTGQTYPKTAEVATKQTLDDGTIVWDDVRLVKDRDGNWCWFFGKERQFVLDQIERFVADENEVLEFGSWGARLGEPCTATIDCGQYRASTRCVQATRDGATQRVCLHGPNGDCESIDDCHQEEGKTECVGGTAESYSRGVCLRAEGANCKSSRDCQELLTCLTGLCAKAR